MFHAMCGNAADCLIGHTRARRSEPAWVQVYRAVEHGEAKKRCRTSDKIAQFPKAIENFAALFAEMQEKRHRADYDPTSRFVLSDVRTLIARTERAIEEFGRASVKDRRAFAAFVVLKLRR